MWAAAEITPSFLSAARAPCRHFPSRANSTVGRRARPSAAASGFTLVELAVVIVILGILAAVAIPRYASFTKESRIAALNGLAGAIRSSVAVVQGRYMATGATTSPVTLADGTTVAVTTGAGGGVPTVAAAGIQAAVNTNNTFTFNAGTGVWDFPTPITNCFLTYAANGTVSLTSTGC